MRPCVAGNRSYRLEAQDGDLGYNEDLHKLDWLLSEYCTYTETRMSRFKVAGVCMPSAAETLPGRFAPALCNHIPCNIRRDV